MQKTPINKIPVVLLCGGEGTRLRDVTRHCPKPLLEIGPDPIILHIMRIYASYGVRRFILCLGYRSEMLKRYFLDYQVNRRDLRVQLGSGSMSILDEETSMDWEIVLAETGAKTMTGARIKAIERYVDTPVFMATYGDGVANIDIGALLAFHSRGGTIGTMTGVKVSSQFGQVHLDDDKVTGFAEKPKLDGFVNGGYFVFERRFFDYVSADPQCVLERDPLERLTAEGQLRLYRHHGFWQCLDTPKDYKLLNDQWARGDAAWLRPSLDD